MLARPSFIALLSITDGLAIYANLGAGLGLASTFHLTRLGAGNVVRRNPIGVVGGSGRNGRVGGLLDGDGLGALGGGTLLAGLAALALLREVGGDPHGVEEVDDTSEASQEEEVKEDARSDSDQPMGFIPQGCQRRQRVGS